MGDQLTFDLPIQQASGVEDFFIAQSNEEALSWLDRWPDWPNRALILYGPQGSGKSHLAAIWRRRSDACLLQADELSDNEIVRAGAGHVVLDHVERVSRPENWELVLHLLNLVREQGHTILLLARQAPSLWPVELADLRSRLGAIQAVAISEPEDQLLSAVLLKLLADRQIRASKDVVAYVAARIERSYAAAGRVAAALDAQALGEQRALTVPLARRVLEDLSAGRAD